jgi:hypothetical protein
MTDSTTAQTTAAMTKDKNLEKVFGHTSIIEKQEKPADIAELRSCQTAQAPSGAFVAVNLHCISVVRVVKN